jgi:FkbM family methyltransferase
VLQVIDQLDGGGGDQQPTSLWLHRFAFNRGDRRILRLPRAAVKAALLSRQIIQAAPNERVRALMRWWKWQAVRRISDAPVVVDFERYAFALPRWSQIGGTIVAVGTHEKNETCFLDALVRRGDVFIDVGANIGYYSVRIAAAGARVVAIEPTEKALASLRHSLDLNQLSTNVSVYACALSDTDGTARFDDSGDVGNHIGGSPAGCLVDVRRLDGLMRSVPDPGRGGLTVLKVDAEGHDLDVLGGARRFLAERRPVVMCEAWAGGDRLRKILSEAEYRLFLPATQGLAPLPHDFHQANVIGVPEELMPEVMGRLGALSWRPITAPPVRSWGVS